MAVVVFIGVLNCVMYSDQSHLRQNTLFFRPYLNGVWVDCPKDSGAKSPCLWQAFSRPCAVIATVGYAHRVPTLGEDEVGKHSPF